MPDSYSDRHLDIADELRGVLAVKLPPADKIVRAYTPDESVIGIEGKTVWVFPTTEEDADRLTRAKVLTDYGFAIVTAQKYGEPAESGPDETVPKEWTDQFCGWVRDNVYTPLNDAVRKSERLIADAWPQTCRLAVKYDPDRLRAKIAWSVVEVTFRESTG
jgi:hypothetical protein